MITVRVYNPYIIIYRPRKLCISTKACALLLIKVLSKFHLRLLINNSRCGSLFSLRSAVPFDSLLTNLAMCAQKWFETVFIHLCITYFDVYVFLFINIVVLLHKEHGIRWTSSCNIFCNLIIWTLYHSWRLRTDKYLTLTYMLQTMTG